MLANVEGNLSICQRRTKLEKDACPYRVTLNVTLGEAPVVPEAGSGGEEPPNRFGKKPVAS